MKPGPFLPTLFLALMTSACAWNATTSSPGGAATDAPADRLVVTVEDDTDKSYLNDVGDPSSLYRDIATNVAAALTGAGIPASAFDSPGARRLTVRLRRIQLTNNSRGSAVDLRFRAEYVAELADWAQPYVNDVNYQRQLAGGVSPTVLRELLSTLIVNELSGDNRLLSAARP